MTKFTKIGIIAVMSIVLLFVVVQIQGCGACRYQKANIIGIGRECVDGVEYLQFPSGVTVAYNPDGSIKQCGRR